MKLVSWCTLEDVAGVDTATLLPESRRLCGEDQWKASRKTCRR